MSTTTTTAAAARKAEAKAQAPALKAAEAAEASSIGARYRAANRRIRRDGQTAANGGTIKATSSDRALVDALDGAKAGAIFREREAMAELVENYTALGRRLTLAEAAECAEAMSELEAAEARTREAQAAKPAAARLLARLNAEAADRELTADEAKARQEAADLLGRRTVVGRYSPGNDRARMTAAELNSMARQAAAAELAARRQAGFRLSNDAYAEALRDFTCYAVMAALDRSAKVEAARLQDALAAPRPLTRVAAIRLARLEREAMAPLATMPAWTAPYVAEATRGLTARDRDNETNRRRWTAFLRDQVKDAAKANRLAAERAAEALKAAQDPADLRQAKAAKAVDTAKGQAEALADLLAAAGRPLDRNEAAAIGHALDGLTTRQRAEAQGVTFDTAKQHAKRGRRALAARWPDLEAMRADLTAARRQANRADLAEARQLGPVRLAARGANRPADPAAAEAAWRHATDTARIMRALAVDVEQGCPREALPAPAGRPADVLAWIDLLAAAMARALALPLAPAPVGAVKLTDTARRGPAPAASERQTEADRLANRPHSAAMEAKADPAEAARQAQVKAQARQAKALAAARQARRREADRQAKARHYGARPARQVGRALALVGGLPEARERAALLAPR